MKKLIILVFVIFIGKCYSNNCSICCWNAHSYHNLASLVWNLQSDACKLSLEYLRPRYVIPVSKYSRVMLFRIYMDGPLKAGKLQAKLDCAFLVWSKFTGQFSPLCTRFYFLVKSGCCAMFTQSLGCINQVRNTLERMGGNYK